MIINDHQKMYESMKELKSWGYIDPIGYSSGSIEDYYRTCCLSVTKKAKDDYIENRLHIEPSMVGTFYYYMFMKKKIPNQVEYIVFYFAIHNEWVKHHVGKEYHEAFVGRLSRFYPSMLRDVHFYHVLKESDAFQKTLFVLKYDIEAKVDCFVKRKGSWYGIQLRTKTKRSNEFYEKKKFRNAMNVKAKLIDLPIDLKKARSLPTKKDSIKLYGREHVLLLTDIIGEENGIA
ncbi:hypothetical protein IMZ31_21640 (plasmid) [Pontibacillus sp. ALD_SL1]|uniref:hypothetical protein n=1 Tax=Pontibacillus sp. ALD_SL1 TaxID=2777185 RepID=UPI001A9679E0|nr:hypothetical protein [Pontibacillus sp. ALD_SL1]QST02056.1 hypothetical protein IMZ31_21640 [Pontibacillus sp. ALD_SL1]